MGLSHEPLPQNPKTPLFFSGWVCHPESSSYPNSLNQQGFRVLGFFKVYQPPEIIHEILNAKPILQLQTLNPKPLTLNLQSYMVTLNPKSKRAVKP